MELTVRLEALPVELGEIEARGEAELEFESRTSGTRFDGMRPHEVEAILPRVITAGDLFRAANIPGLVVSNKMIAYGPLSTPTMGTCVEVNRMRSRGGPGGCAMVLVYVNDVHIEDAGVKLQWLDPSTISHFRVLSGLEAGARYGTGSARGILLIYTHGN